MLSGVLVLPDGADGAEFNSLDEACVAVQAEQAGEDATWMPLSALISAEMFKSLGNRVGYSKNRMPAIPGALLL